ncbi:hypothetical protein F5Y07DRAFT_239664 [Xylaria sp. FL0933]|nr:hypothetical protein F5Y07DRAFT_239664 [Xylaria sp. FL0933]
MDENYIEDLLERYLHLLHDYTTLREELTALQTGMYQNIARANFAAERGLRFGQDYYDDRMQASRRLVISCDSQDQDQAQASSENQDRKTVMPSSIVTSFAVIDLAATVVRTPALIGDDPEAKNEAPNPHPHPSPKAGAEAESAEQSAPNIEKVRSAPTPLETDAAAAAQPRDRNGGTTTGEQHPPNSSPPSPPPPPLPEVAEKEKGTGTAATLQKKKSNDPLRWFGLLTPMPLRQAQAQSIRAVEHVIPRLATLDAEMAAVEIEVRRARKRRAKAEAAAAAAVASKPS